MRLLKLAYCGVGPYPKRQEINFEDFEPDGLMLISGPTGGGKTTILDAIVFALYGRIADTDSDPSRMRSAYCDPADPTWVELEFEVSSGQYRIRRSPAYLRPKKRGTGFTEQVATAQLFRLNDLANPLATRPVDVGPLVNDLVGLNAEQFCQTVILPQGKFDTFLRAKSDERKKVLESIFRTQKYQKFEDELRGRAKKAKTASREAAGKVEAAWGDFWEQATTQELAFDTRTPSAPEVSRIFAGPIEAATQHLDQARTRLRELDKSLAEGRQIMAARSRQEKLQATLAELTAQEPAMKELTASVEASHEARPVLENARSYNREKELLEGATKAFEVASEAAESQIAEIAFYHPQVASCSSELAQKLLPYVGLEAELAKMRTDLAKCTEQVNQAESDMAGRKRAFDLSREKIEKLLIKVKASENALEASKEHKEKLDFLQEQQRANLNWKQAAAELVEAADKKFTAARALDTAKSNEEHLGRLRMQNLAAELAGHLSPGVPCPACGSTAHPNPAPASGHQVSLAELTQAYKDTAAATAEFKTLVEKHKQALAKTTQAEQAISIPAQQLEPQLQLEQTLYEQARRQADKLPSYRQDLDQQKETEAHLDTCLALAKDALERAKQQKESLETQITQAKEKLAGINTGGLSVADLHQKLSHIQAGQVRLKTAEEHLASASASAKRAHQHLLEALAHTKFADLAQAREHYLDQDELSKRLEVVSTWQGKKESCATQLEEPELQELAAKDIPNLETLKARVAEAGKSSDEANQSLGRLQAQRDNLLATLGRAERAQDQLEKVQGEGAEVLWLTELVTAGPANQDSIPLTTWVLLERLNQILEVANPHLQAMSAGRYELVRTNSDGGRSVNQALSLAVRDHFSDTVRRASSLSGGEMFYCSLALSLALAEVVSLEAGGIVIETMLIDEGFGSLDPQKLDSVMSQLRHSSAGRLVGIISHVRELANQIGPKVEVIASESGSALKITSSRRL